MNSQQSLKSLRRHPVLQQEISTLPRELLDFPLFRRSFIVLSVAAHILIGLIALGMIITTLIGSTYASATVDWLTLPIVVCLVHVGGSILADLTMIIRTVYWWHATQRQEQLDILRTTLPSDRALLRIFTTANLLRGWRVLQIDVALRAAVTVVTFCVAYFSGLQALSSVLSGVGYAYGAQASAGNTWMRAGLFASIAVCAIMSGQMYVRNPARRGRSTVNFSTWIALRIKDSIAAILLAVGGCLALRIVIGAVFIGVVYQSGVMLTTLNRAAFFDPENVGGVLWACVWFIGLTLIAWLGSNYFYAALDSVLEDRALATLRSGN